MDSRREPSTGRECGIGIEKELKAESINNACLARVKRGGVDTSGSSCGGLCQVTEEEEVSKIQKDRLIVSPSRKNDLAKIVNESPLLSKLKAVKQEHVGTKSGEPNVALGGSQISPSLPRAMRSNNSEDRCPFYIGDPSKNLHNSKVEDNVNNDFDFEEIEAVPSLRGSESDNHVAISERGVQSVKMGTETEPSQQETMEGRSQNSGERQDVAGLNTSVNRSINMKEYDVMSSDADSGDEDLLETPSVFHKISGVTSEAKPKIKRRNFDSDSELELSVSLPKVDKKRDEFCIDDLLSVRDQENRRNEEFKTMEESLKVGLQHGGVRNIAVESTSSQNQEMEGIDYLPDELKTNVIKLIVKKKEIVETHPGEIIFKNRYKNLFSEKLSLGSCGFKPSPGAPSKIDLQLVAIDEAMLPMILTHEWISLCFEAISCPHPFLNWLLQLLSVHPNNIVIKQVHCILYDVIQKKTGKGSDWVPDIHIIARIFMNYGAELSTLFPDGRVLSMDIQTKESQDLPPHAGDAQLEVYRLENLQKVYRTIADAASKKEDVYSSEDIHSLILMVLVSSLDQRLSRDALSTDISIALSGLINAFPTDKWKENVISLCKVIHRLTNHHHNKVSLVSVLPTCDRGRYLQKELAFSLLHELLLGQSVGEEVIDRRVASLLPLVPLIRIKGEDVDYYLTSSLIMLVDLSVGNENLHSREKADFMRLHGLMKGKMSEIRDSINVLDRSLVKDRLVRLTARWQFMYEGMGSKERTLFAYATSALPPPEEKVDCRNSDESDMDIGKEDE